MLSWLKMLFKRHLGGFGWRDGTIERSEVVDVSGARPMVWSIPGGGKILSRIDGTMNRENVATD
jgi:hypothetical protein